jgi:quercetin dioxygenase-like cupin family protein
MKQQPIIRTMDQVAPSEVARARGATIQVLLGPGDELPRFYTRRFTIQPGGRIPLHRHDTIEHEQVVLEGEMRLVLDADERVVRAGDCIYIPAGVAHSYETVGSRPVRFLCMVPALEYQTEFLE